MCWSRYEDRWTIEDERVFEEETRRLIAEAQERSEPRADAEKPESEQELVEA
jgi:hypothetical protein